MMLFIKMKFYKCRLNKHKTNNHVQYLLTLQNELCNLHLPEHSTMIQLVKLPMCNYAINHQ